MAAGADRSDGHVTKGTKLDVNNFAGDVQVKVWDQDAVRVEVEPLRPRNDRHQAGRSGAVDPVASVRGGPPRRSTTR